MKTLNFIKFKNITGTSTHSLHPNEIIVESWHVSFTKDGPFADKAFVQDLSFVKYADSASTDLLLACCNSTKFDEVILSVSTSGKKPYDTMVITMNNVYITSASPGATTGAYKATENVSLNFESVKIVYNNLNTDGTTQQSKIGWDVANNKQL